MEFTTHLELHSQATRLKGKLNPQSDDNHTGLSPSMGNWSRIPTDLGCTTNCRKWASQTLHSQTSIKNEGFSAGLFPFRSPLLGESFLVSFPPLNDMLKFSGWPCPIWGLRFNFSNFFCCLKVLLQTNRTQINVWEWSFQDLAKKKKNDTTTNTKVTIEMHSSPCSQPSLFQLPTQNESTLS